MNAEYECMRSRARTEFIVAAVFIVLGHGLDQLSTYIVNPDLSREVGFLYLKLVSLGFGGWFLVTLYKALFALISVLVYWLIIRARRQFYPAEPGKSLHDFLFVMHGKNAVYRPNGHWMMPSPRLILVWAVYIMMMGAATYAWVLGIHNLSGSPMWMMILGQYLAGLVGFLGFWISAWQDYRSGDHIHHGEDCRAR